ncbi:MAG: stage V sporulation protein AD [Lachnospiraceae bacterium]|nr:stage V sporulation protein AD [Lachnospiraceae bacterium]
MEQMRGKQSIQLENAVYIISHACVTGSKEGEGPLGKKIDCVGKDDMFGQESWELAESAIQQKAALMVLDKAGLSLSKIRYIFAGDLLGQLIATSFGLEEFDVPLFGLYGACSTCGEALALGAMTVSAGYGDYVMAMTSSHYASAEKQFRTPLEYGNQRPLAASWTVTGSGAFILSGKHGRVRISGMTIGKVVDYGIKDALNMGAAMAPAACDTIVQNLKDFERTPEDYDQIITGDLGSVGQKILWDLTMEQGFVIEKNHMDCGMVIYDSEKQDTHAGGSGCGCSAVTLAAYILPLLERGTWKRVLFVPTGALLSTISFNERQSIPGIAHGIVLEHVE